MRDTSELALYSNEHEAHEHYDMQLIISTFNYYMNNEWVFVLFVIAVHSVRLELIQVGDLFWNCSLVLY